MRERASLHSSQRNRERIVAVLGLTERAAITAIGYHEARIESIRTHGRLNELGPTP
jgi:hypothetical protein